MGKILNGAFSTSIIFMLVLFGGFAVTDRNKTSENFTVSKNGQNYEQNKNQVNSGKENITVKDFTNIKISVGGKTFTATLEDNNTVKALVKQLPLTVDMSELNGNEKYNFLSNNLRADASICPGKIHQGYLMLYDSNCLVLFYETFNTSYSYVKLGHINNTEGLADAVGSGNVKITFSINE